MGHNLVNNVLLQALNLNQQTDVRTEVQTIQVNRRPLIRIKYFDLVGLRRGITIIDTDVPLQEI